MMVNMNEEEYVPKEDKFLKKRSNGMIISDYHIEVLRRNGIDYEKYGSISEILFDINEILEEAEDEELEIVARELDERNYYSSKVN